MCYFHHAISKVLFINMNYKWLFWLWSPGWGNVVRLTHSKISWFFSPLPTVYIERKSICTAHIFILTLCTVHKLYSPYEGRVPIVCKLSEILHGICIFSLVYYFVQLFIYIHIDSWMLILYFALELSTTSFFLSFFYFYFLLFQFLQMGPLGTFSVSSCALLK